MGCSCSNSFDFDLRSLMHLNKKEEVIETYEDRLKKYKDFHDTILGELATSEFCEDVRQLETVREKSIVSKLDSLVKKYLTNSLRSSKHMNKEKMKLLLNEVVGEHIINKEFKLNNINIFNTIKSLFQELKFSTAQIEFAKKALSSFEKEFEMSMRPIVYHLTNDTKTLHSMQIEGILSTLKFHNEFTPEILSIIVNQNLFEKEDNLDSFAEMILKTETIKIVIILINPVDDDNKTLDEYGLDCSHYKFLYKILEAVSGNRNIKGLFFHSIKDYELKLAPELANLIIKKLQTESLVAFHIGNIELSDSFINNLFFQVRATHTLLFLSIHNYQIFEILNDFTKNILMNDSLVAVAISGYYEYLKDYDNLENILKEKKKKIQFVYVSQKSYINLPFKYEEYKK